MRHHHDLFLLPIAILAACGGAGTTDDPSQRSPSDTAFWANINCDHLEGLAFAITYYMDNQPQGTDVLRFLNNKMSCDGCAEQDLRAGAFECRQDAPGSVSARAMMTTDSQLRRRYVFTLAQGRIDGQVAIKINDEFVTQTFEGQLTQ